LLQVSLITIFILLAISGDITPSWKKRPVNKSRC
jgi:hypothetical protein